MKHVAGTNLGMRSKNEDAFFESENLFIVCDGVGGNAYGEIASKLTCASFSEYFEQNPIAVINEDYLNKALKYTVQKFQDTESKYPEMKGMATTIVLIAFDEAGAIVGWLGDSRLYHIRNGEILFASEDHSLVNDLRKQGNTDEAQLKTMRNFITKCVSGTAQYQLSLHRFAITEIQQGDYFFLCTDGVLENVTNEMLCAELNTQNTLEAKAQKMFSLCEGKTKDNFTFILIHY